VVLRLIYACGLRVSEAVSLEVTDIKRDGPRLHLCRAKGNKDRLVPLPLWAYRELQDYWRTHRHPRWVFPGVGRGWRETPGGIERLGHAVEPMGVGSIQHCVRLARVDARLPASTHVHTLRHSYATHLLEEGVSIRLISAYLGHASLETTLIYTHLTAVNEASARVVLDRLRPEDLA
jgi:site-specific recombinase XerD